MRILLIHNHYRLYGGEETYFKALVWLLKKKGHKVHIYAKDSKNISTLTDRISSAVKLFWNPEMENELTEIIIKFRPDVVQLQNVYPLISPRAYKICSDHNIPVVQRISSYRLLCPKGWLFRNNRICELCVKKCFAFPALMFGCYHESRVASFFFTASLYFHRYVLRSYNSVNAYVFPSQFIRDYYVSSNAVPFNKAFVIPTFKKPTRVPQAKTGEQNYFVYAGRLSAEKGIIPILDLFSQSPLQRLIVIGKDANNTLGSKYKAFKNISFKGFLNADGVVDYLEKAQATLMPSIWYDVLPNVLIESFSVGTPVIAPRLGVFPELIRHKKTGMLYDTTEDLLQILAKFKKTPAVKNSVLKEFGEKYLPQKHYMSLFKLYESFI